MKILKILVSFSSLSALCNISISQTFQRSFGTTGSEIGTCIQSTVDGNYIMSGTSTGFSNGSEDFYLLKMNTAGTVLWFKAYGGTYNDKNYYVSVCSDGGFIMTGYTYSAGSTIFTNLYLVKTDSDGILAWSQVVGGSKEDLGWYVNETNDGGFLTVGSTKSFNSIGDWNGYMVKVNSAGALQWTKVMGGTNDDWFHGMNKTTDGGFIIAGVTGSNTFGSSDIWLVKLDSGGDTLWTKQYGKNTEDAGNAVIQTADGGYMVVGDIHVNPNAGDHNTCLLKTDASGNLQWVKTYGSSPGSEIGWAVRQTPDNGYVLAGSSGFYGNGGGGDYFLVRTTSTGNLLWSQAYGSSKLDDMWYLQKTANEGNMIIGSTQSASGGPWDIYLVNTDSLGNSTCNTTSVTPLVNTPTLLTRSGTIITTGGTVAVPNTTSYIAITLDSDPCALVDIPENEYSGTEVLIYPNPFSETTQILLPEKAELSGTLTFYNLMGQEITPFHIKNPRGYTLYKGDLKSGVYFYKLELINGNTAVGKVIVE